MLNAEIICGAPLPIAPAKLTIASPALRPICGNSPISCLTNSIIRKPEPPIAAATSPIPVPNNAHPAPAARHPTPSNATAPAKPNNPGNAPVNKYPAAAITANAPAKANRPIPTCCKLN